MNLKKSLFLLVLCLPTIVFSQLYYKYTYDGIERDYILYLPEDLPENSPLVFVFHGYTGSAYNIMNYCGMNEVADENNFAVCYPKGTSDNSGNNFWQVGYAFHENEDVDDVGFVKELAAYLQSNYNLNSQYTFTTGMSNGGDLSFLLACEASETFFASAPVAGCMMKWIYDSCQPENVLPIFAINGTADNTTWWDGDINNAGGWGAYMSTMDAVELWRDLNNTTATSIDTLDNIDPNDGSFVIDNKSLYGDNNHEVWLYKIVGGGHDWPGSSGNMDINTGEEVWKFFEKVMNTSTASLDEEAEERFNSFLIQPNPATNFIIIESKNYIFAKFEIYNSQGTQVMFGDIESDKQYVDISKLDTGAYQLIINDTAHKFIKFSK